MRSNSTGASGPGRWRLGLLWLAALPTWVLGAADFSTTLQALQQAAGRDRKATLPLVVRARDAAARGGHLAEQLSLDELRCRILTDEDPSLALQAAQAALQPPAGAATAAGGEGTAVQGARWRLRACAAGAVLDMGQTQAGEQLLSALVEEAAREPAGAAAQGMALLERGLHRSRRGELILGQNDLLQACALLRDQGQLADRQLCEWHLANHYKRTGDHDESLSIMQQLMDSAQQLAQRDDIAVYAYGMAQVHLAREAWREAARGFQASLDIARATKDDAGVAYCEHGLATTAWRMGQRRQALAHLDLGDAALQHVTDPLQQLRAHLLRAEVLLDEQQPGEALPVLDRADAILTDARDASLRVDALRLRGRALALQSRWPLAYQQMAEAYAQAAHLSAERLSLQSASWRMQFNRERDAQELQDLRARQAQAERVRQLQGAVIVLALLLLGLTGALALRKIRQAGRLQDLALHDELTGLPNRRAVMQRLGEQAARARRRGERLHVMMVDADRFKAVNDLHGHAVGDEVLRELALRLSGSLRLNDWVGRLGGEEFVVVLDGTDDAQAEAIAQRMRQAVAERPCPTAAGPLPITVSIGLAAQDTDDAAPDALLAAADAALYDAKRQGRNRVAGLVRPAATAAG